MRLLFIVGTSLLWGLVLNASVVAGYLSLFSKSQSKTSKNHHQPRSSHYLHFIISSHAQKTLHQHSDLFQSESSSDGGNVSDSVSALDAAVRNRYACKSFLRADGSPSIPESPSQSDQGVVQSAKKCLDLARLSPSAFNTQPYRIVLVHSPEQKLALSRYCLGPNRQRVLDADCTAVFLADRQILRNTRRFAQFTQELDPKHRPLPKISLLYVAIFSSGFPIPRFLAAISSFLLRMSIGMTDWFLQKIVRRKFAYFPSLSNAETWASKQTSMVAMTYMLACSARGLDTIPMEGINANGIRRVLKIPRGRYAIPMVVATGKAVTPHESINVNAFTQTRRYPSNEVIFENTFG